VVEPDADVAKARRVGLELADREDRGFLDGLFTATLPENS